jgi:hypothetical protein
VAAWRFLRNKTPYPIIGKKREWYTQTAKQTREWYSLADLLAQLVVNGCRLCVPFSGNCAFVLGRLPIRMRVLDPRVFDARYQLVPFF